MVSVIEAVPDYFQAHVESIQTGQRGNSNLPRQVALLICIDNTAATGKEVAERFGIRSSGVSSLGVAYRRRLNRNPTTRRHLAAVRKNLGMSG